MRDVQQERDPRNIQIDRVGVRNVSYPITVMDQQNHTQATTAKVSMSVLLPHEYRGTHMSRFIETLEEYQGQISPRPSRIKSVTDHLMRRLNASEATVSFTFPYFMRKKAPVSGIESFMRYDAYIQGFSRGNDYFDMVVGVDVPVQTLCPCSKEISHYGAHNQRALLSLRVRCVGLVWFEELIRMTEDAASTPLYTLLKREDEKYVTEHAYENPRFVEDVIRNLALNLNDEPRIVWYYTSIASLESIHNHDAFAEISRDKRGSDVETDRRS